MGIFNRGRNQLLTALLEVEAQRLKSNAELETKRQEVELRRYQLELENAESIAKARILDRDAAHERRMKAREYGLRGNAVAKAKRQAAENAPRCPVCEDDHSPNLSAQDIAWHHAGHPDNFTMPMGWN
jgi:hypothetical protein